MQFPSGFLEWLHSRCQTQQISQPQSFVAALTTPVPSEENLEQPWTAQADKPLRDGADLALLSLYHDELSLEPLASVVERASLALPANTL